MKNVEFKLKREGTKFKLFAFLGQHCVGRGQFVICVFNQNTAIIEDLFVLEEYRRQGYGTKIVQECVREILKFQMIREIRIFDGSSYGQTARIALGLGFQKMSDITYTYCK
jgi:GNAT superfamily N-acetyltransferase